MNTPDNARARVLADRYVVETGIDRQRGRIVQEVSSVINGAAQRISRQVMETRDAQVHAALVSLGWTPPPLVTADEILKGNADLEQGA